MALTKSRKWILASGLTLLLLLGTLHFWFSRNAARYLETIVSEQSKGRLRLKVKGFSYNLFTGFIEVRKGSLQSLDTLSQPATYDIQLDKLNLHLQSFWPLLVQRKLLLDSVRVQRPQIRIYRWRKDPSLAARREEVSLPSELGRIYRSLLDGLHAMELKRIGVTGANVVLFDKMNKERPPVRLSGIDFHLYYPGDKNGKANARLLIPAQQVDLPNGRYRLSFKQISLEQFGRRLQLDSCTILTRNSTAKRTRFQLSFKSVLLSGMDFEALYRYNLIRADSVFCTAPQFDIAVQQKGAVQKTENKQAPKEVIGNIMEDLDADLDLAFIGIRNAGFRLRLQGQKERTISNARQDDFSMRRLRINADSSQPFTIGGLDMMVRGYELYNEDSSAVFRFDSVQLRNNRIVLRQFSATTLPGRTLHNERNYQIPYLELEEIDWFALVFEEKLQARNVYLNSPRIYFRALKPKKEHRKQSLFDLLESTGELLSLEGIHVRNGQLHLVPNDHTDIRLNNANLILRPASLLAARNETGVQNSVQELSFSNGSIQLPNGRIRLQDVVYAPSGGLQARQLIVKQKGVDATLQGVTLGGAFVDKEKKSLLLQGLHWEKGNVHLSGLATNNGKQDVGTIVFKEVDGRNTDVGVTAGNMELTTNLQQASAAEITKLTSGPLQLAGLQVKGKSLNFLKKGLQAQATSYRLQDGAFSVTGLDLRQTTATDSLHLQVQSARATLDLNRLLHRHLYVDEVALQSPTLALRRHQTASNAAIAPERAKNRPLQIGEIRITQPALDVTLHRNDSITRLQLFPQEAGNIRIQNAFIGKDSLALGKVTIQAGKLHVSLANGTAFGTEKGQFYLAATKLAQTRHNGKPQWSGTLDSVTLSQPLPLSLGKKGTKFTLSEAAAGHISLPTDGNLGQLWQLPNAWMRTGTGTLRDSNTVVHWVAARYDALTSRLSLDSLAVEPISSREAFIASHRYQADYLTFHSGPLQLTGFNRQLFEREGALEARTINVQRPQITIYRDKRPPFLGGINKLLPTNKLQQLATPLNIGQVQLVNGLVAYTELNDKTNEEGIVTLTNLNASISNIRNQNISANDSLSLRMDALLLDSAKLSLQLRESYADTLAGFIMQLRMRPTSLSFLNPVVAPLSSVNIVSGTVDSLYLNALGSEHMALGEMHLFYRNLRIKLVQFGDNRKPKALLAVASFLANNLLIRKNNNGRKSLMYFERLRDRSVFNFLIKMTMNGIASGVGIKSNKRILKQYHKDLDRLQLPQFSNEAEIEAVVKEKDK